MRQADRANERGHAGRFHREFAKPIYREMLFRARRVSVALLTRHGAAEKSHRLGIAVLFGE
jgi:hypothetical protein